jgi:hypothetical protein
MDMADDVVRVPVTEAEVEAAKLQIEVLEQLGRPVDERLRVIADAKPAERSQTGAKTEYVASPSHAYAAFREALREHLERGNRLTSVRNRNRGRSTSVLFFDPVSDVDVLLGSLRGGDPLWMKVKDATTPGILDRYLTGTSILGTGKSRLFVAYAHPAHGDEVDQQAIEALRKASERRGLGR